MDGVEDFLKKLSLEKFEAMKKSSLLEIGEKLELETRKEKLVWIISEHMVDEQIFEAEILDKLPTESTNQNNRNIRCKPDNDWKRQKWIKRCCCGRSG